MSRPDSRSDGLSASTNIAALSMEAQFEANRLAKEKLEIDRLRLDVDGKVAKIQQIYAISTAIAAIAAVIAAIASSINLILNIIKTS
jgi:hypothetical protein